MYRIQKVLMLHLLPTACELMNLNKYFEFITPTVLGLQYDTYGMLEKTEAENEAEEPETDLLVGK